MNCNLSLWKGKMYCYIASSRNFFVFKEGKPYSEFNLYAMQVFFQQVVPKGDKLKFTALQMDM